EYMDKHWDLLGWSLLPDQYNLVVQVRDVGDDTRSWLEINREAVADFSHFTNGYAKYINRRYDRRGSLFARNFCRSLIPSRSWLVHTIVATHARPLQASLCADLREWPHSSFIKMHLYSDDPLRAKLVRLFNGESEFFRQHSHFIQRIAA
ncbi:MAG TPA: hypothetical protein VFU15_08805, partial [Bacteroidia bacterium]|nr:hypothetical protein [Bacteroidia bacterium]